MKSTKNKNRETVIARSTRRPTATEHLYKYSFFLSFCLFVCLSVCLFVCLSVSFIQSQSWFERFWVCLSVTSSVFPFSFLFYFCDFQFFCRPVFLPVFFFLSFHLYVFHFSLNSLFFVIYCIIFFRFNYSQVFLNIFVRFNIFFFFFCEWTMIFIFIEWDQKYANPDVGLM